jgi:hypothetical protein
MIRLKLQFAGTLLLLSLTAVSCNSNDSQPVSYENQNTNKIADDSFEKNLKCRELAQKLDTEARKADDANNSGGKLVSSFQGSKTKFSNQLNTCVYYSTYIMYHNDDPIQILKFIKDSITNEQIAYFNSGVKDEQKKLEADIKFDEAYAKYFSDEE